MTVDEPSTRRSVALLKRIEVKAKEVLALEATANQLRGEVANAISHEAPSLSRDLDDADMTALLRAVAELAR